ncbi:hypothetical protein BDV40DRAFT_114724 [Aspergillus tamarii]|uniref:Uncharacterized protein n=1 Tax=Aspergillus tamarii TaxID=41984 RepID=A0A5N6V0L3_ASPTM|nr:hypothetical protein BDV40DRAFT_114724 [Aspergillus tamarii]
MALPLTLSSLVMKTIRILLITFYQWLIKQRVSSQIKPREALSYVEGPLLGRACGDMVEYISERDRKRVY